MKKHIKKKFLFEFELTEEQAKELEGNSNIFPVEEITQKIKKVPKDLSGFLITDSNTVFQAFPYRHEGQVRFIPEPDPVLVYFHAAYMNYRQIADKKKEILKIIGKDKMDEPIITELYDYFGLTSGFIIFLFTAMEAFINRSIPGDFIYKKQETKKTELFNKQQIVEFLPFNEKLKTVLTSALNKDFPKTFPLKYQHITNLKEFRDSIVHTKISTDGNSPYDYLYKKALTFNYLDSMNAVADFCNYYHPKDDYIVECDCTKDW